MGTSWWPLFLIIGSNLIYQSSSRCASKDAQPFAALAVVYTIAAIGSLLLFAITGRGSGSLLTNIRALNWANYLLGLAIIGLEGGFLYLYRNGWSVSVGPICSYCGVAIGLLILGALCFHEHITLKQILGTILCLGGIALISLK
ncbi:MAG: EamA family transporter [Victivallales bacterium]|nr:EamA family transporter [Victivallales bacterium]